MSTEIDIIRADSTDTRDIDVTQFFGGERGLCIQLTQGTRYIQIDRSQIAALINTLDNWELDQKESE